MSRGGKRKGSGAKKKEPTENITFRILKTKKLKLIQLFSGEINQMFDIWANKLIKDKEDEKSIIINSIDQSDGIGTE